MVSYNRQSNDDHFTVIQLILKTGRLPEKADCWECFQPKLFTYTAAKVLQLTGLNNTNPERMILYVELLNFFAGFTTLLVIGFFLNKLPGRSELLKILAFGLVAFNPALIGINSQATNDPFVILFSTLALFFTYAFLHEKRLVTFLFILLFTVLAISSKATGWIPAIAIFLALLINAWMEKPPLFLPLGIAGLFAVLVIITSIFNPLNQYIPNYRDYGSPILTNIDKRPFPHFLERTYTDRPGIVSIQDGFFTFKFMDLLRHPRIENGNDYPAHRTSLWT